MRSSQQQNKQRIGTQRRFAVWVCALSLLLQGLLPIITVSAKAATDVPATSAFADFNYICTAYGIQPIEQAASSPSGKASGGIFCPLCQIHSVDLAITPPTLPSLSISQSFDDVGIPAYQGANLSGRIERPTLPRAPPARS